MSQDDLDIALTRFSLEYIPSYYIQVINVHPISKHESRFTVK